MKGKLIMLKDLPPHLQKNPYVLSGYRPLLDVTQCMKSLLYIHNESFNILSHAVPLFYILWNYSNLLPWNSISIPVLPHTHVIALIAPWIGSCCFHLFNAHKSGVIVYHKLLKFDLFGIWITQCLGAFPTLLSAGFCLKKCWLISIFIVYIVASVWGLSKAFKANSMWERRAAFSYPFYLRTVMLLLRMSPFGGGHPESLQYVFLQDIICISGVFIGCTYLPERFFPAICMHQAAILDLQWMSIGHCILHFSN